MSHGGVKSEQVWVVSAQRKLASVNILSSPFTVTPIYGKCFFISTRHRFFFLNQKASVMLWKSQKTIFNKYSSHPMQNRNACPKWWNLSFVQEYNASSQHIQFQNAQCHWKALNHPLNVFFSPRSKPTEPYFPCVLYRTTTKLEQLQAFPIMKNSFLFLRRQFFSSVGFATSLVLIQNRSSECVDSWTSWLFCFVTCNGFVAAGNYCRNPYDWDGPWCDTVNGHEYCDIPKCNHTSKESKQRIMFRLSFVEDCMKVWTYSVVSVILSAASFSRHIVHHLCPRVRTSIYINLKEFGWSIEQRVPKHLKPRHALFRLVLTGFKYSHK